MQLTDCSHLSLEEMRKRFDLLAIDAKEYAVFIIGIEGNLICWNVGAERLFGYASHEIMGQNFSRFFAPDDVLTGQPEYELGTAIREGRAHNNCWQIRKDGSRFWGHSTTTALLNNKGQARSFARVVHDLTEINAVAAQQKRADELAEANRCKEEFMALLSHELRGPLSPIRNALSILRQLKTNDPLIEQAGNIIDRQVGVMVRLVDDLLDISRITKGKLRLAKELVDLRVIVNHSAESIRPIMNARKHDFSVAIPIHPIWISADAGRMEQVVINLLDNAAKYSDNGGQVHLIATCEDDDAVIRITDNGAGIPPEQLSQIFELFTQVDGSLGRSYGGLGIGLALARNLVELHDGRIQAASDGLNKGSEFTIKLPLCQEADLPEIITRVESTKSERCLNVLVVEDYIDAADSLSLLLRLNGYNVQIAHTGAIALKLAASSRLDLVLLDIGLPGMDGYQVATRMRQLPGFDNVILCALTGYTPSEADIQRQHEAGFNHFYIKPIGLDHLLELIKTYP